MAVAAFVSALVCTSGEAHDAARASRVAALNAIPDLPWRAGLNVRWLGLPVGSSASLCGSVGLTDERVARLRRKVKEGTILRQRKLDGAEVAHLPRKFEAATH